MDPLFLSLAVAVATGISTVAGKLIDKGVVEPALEPATEKIKSRIQSGADAAKNQETLAHAILSAIEDASGLQDETLAIKYARRIRLSEIIQPGNQAIRDQVMRLVYLASSDDPGIVPDTLLTALRLPVKQRPALARFLFHLRRRLSDLDDFRPLLAEAHKQTVEAELRRMTGVIEPTPDGLAARVRVVEPEWNAEPYLRYLAAECNRLRLSVIDPQYVTPTGESKITLAQVYTDLDVTLSMLAFDRDASGKVHLRQPRESDMEQLGKRGEVRRVTALEAVSFREQPRIALLGDPGGGKSTFVNYLAFCLAMARLEPDAGWLERLPGWAQDKLLPVRVVLRELIAWAEAKGKLTPSAGTLWEFIQHDLTAHGVGEAFAPLKRQLQEQGGLVLLDGLDEVPDAQQRREFIKAVLEDFARGCGLCRIVVTCRVYAYQKKEWKLEDYAEFTLAPFSPEQIERFIQRWYDTVRLTEGWNEATAQAKANALVTASRQPYLQELASRPLLLTLMATLHTARGKLPDDRADLYTDCVRLLLDYWQRGKVTLVDGQKQSEDGVLDALGLPRSRLEQALSQVAFEAHQRQGRRADRKPETADISGEELRRVLKPALNNSLDSADKVIYYIQTRAGLLAERGEDTYAFPHRTFQEFLAACYLLDSEEFPYNLADLVCRDRDWWREVFLLAAGRARSTTFGQAVALINALCDADCPVGQIEDEKAFAAALAAQAAAEVRLPERARSPGKYQSTLNRLQNWLVGIIQQGKLPLEERAGAGRLLSVLGDRRSDVACPVPALVAIPSGEFSMGSGRYDDEKPLHRVSLQEYRIGKYPVTNAQYRRFVEDGGYTERWRDCWTDAGWRWREQNDVEKPDYWDDPIWNLDNHPVVGVSWYEAVAYCNWLTRTDAQSKFRLPTEAEWEKAARGAQAEGREWPWGNEFDPEKANTRESGIGRTTAVGLFPGGASPYDARDMAGNVWEWCSSIGYYKYKASGPEEDGSGSLEGDQPRALRGGSWYLDRDDARCACRGRLSPGDRDDSLGFRVAESVLPGFGSES